jgi:ferrous iron transport protein B
MVGRKLAPLGIWLGLDWPMLVALMTSVLRKENTITTLTVLYGVGQQHASLYEALSGHVVPAAALAFLAVQVLFVPCAATIAAVYSETKSWKWTLLNISAFLVVSLLVGILIYQGGRLFNWGV